MQDMTAMEYAERFLSALEDLRQEVAYIGKELRQARTGVAEDDSGQPIQRQRWTCTWPTCGKINDAEYEWCWHCGRSTRDAATN